MDTFLALEIIALALSGLLIWHSARTRGAVFTCMFFIGGAFLGLIRENVVAQVAALNLYDYSPAAFHLWVGAAPLILMVFWSYTIYLARSGSHHRWQPHLAVARPDHIAGHAFMASAACLNGPSPTCIPWFVGKFKPALTIWGGTPARCSKVMRHSADLPVALPCLRCASAQFTG
jgi:hypothetical protein